MTAASLRWMPILLCCCASAQTQEGVSTLRIEETIKANKAQPQVISILPWQPPKYRNIEGILEWQPKASTPQRLERNIFLNKINTYQASQGVLTHTAEQNLN